MQRVIVAVIVSVVVLLGLTLGTVSRSTAGVGAALQETPTPPAELCPADAATPAEAAAPAEATPVPGWETLIDVRPDAAPAAVVKPRDVTGEQRLYLSIWTLRPGTCIPYSARGNQKDGAVILIVQQGIIDFTARPYGDDPKPSVRWGRVSSEDGIDYAFGARARLYPGDWVTMSDQVWFTFRSVGGESAVVLKAVWANPPIDAGCSGGCK
jgi:hypothetical protein